MAMLEGEHELTLDLLNRATQAWIEQEYHRRVHKRDSANAARSLSFEPFRRQAVPIERCPPPRFPYGATQKAGGVSPLTFVEMSAPLRNEPIEIVLPSGVRTRVASNFDAAALGRVLDTLGGRQ